MTISIKQISILMLLLVATQICFAERKNILVVKSSDKLIYSQLVDSFKNSTFRESNFQANIVEIESTDPELKDKLNASKKTDLVITIGANATKFVIAVAPNTPVYSTLVPKQTYENILKSNSVHNNSRFSAIFLDQPPGRYMDLLKHLLPRHKSVGILAGPVVQTYLSTLNNEATARNLALNTQKINNTENVSDKAKSVIKNIDALLALPDPLIYNKQNAKWLLYMSYRQKIPVIAYSNSFVKAGALSAIFSTPEQIGYQLGEIILNHFDGTPLNKSVFPKYYTTTINSSVARSLEIEIPNLNDFQNLIPREASDAE